MKQGKGRTIRKVMGVGGLGNFQLARIFFFFSLTASAGFFFFQVNPSALFFFFFSEKYCFFLNSEILIHYLCFCAL